MASRINALDARTRSVPRAWRRALTALLLTLLVAVAAAPAGVADDKRPPGAAEGTDLSQLPQYIDNPLLSPPLRPVQELRLALSRILNDKDAAFDPARNGAVDYIDPTLLTREQILNLLQDPTNMVYDQGEIWYAAPVEVTLVRDFLKPEVLRRLDTGNVTHVIAVVALNNPGGEHSEQIIRRVLNKHGIDPEATAFDASERQQCATRCAVLYSKDTPTAYARRYDLTVAEYAQMEKDIRAAREKVAHLGPKAQEREEAKAREPYDKLKERRNEAAYKQMGVDLDNVQASAEIWTEPTLPSLFSRIQADCPPSQAQPGRLSASEFVLTAAAAEGADTCGRDGKEKTTPDTTGIGSALTLPTTGNGGIDFSTLQLRYLADPGDGSGLQYSFSAGLDPLRGDIRRSTAITAATQSSDAFFVWLALNPSAFWVNLNPNEPDRIVDDRLGRTDAGRVLLEADLRMKKTVGKLIHPHTALGRKFWDQVEGDCMSFRTWIVPATASIHQDGGKLYILDAPLDVKMETDYLKAHGNSTAATCPRQDKATEHANEALFRGLILPRLKKAINTAPEYAALRRVYLSRVAAEWYRDLSWRKKTTYGDLIDTGNVTDWRTTSGWRPKDTFDQYVDSYTKGEFKVTDRTTSGGVTYVKSYVYGGVDLTSVPLRNVSDERFRVDFGKLRGGVNRSLRIPSTSGTDDTVWLGAATPLQTSGVHSAPHGLAPAGLSASEWAVRLLPLPLPLLAALWWWHRGRLATRPGPLARTAFRRSRSRRDIWRPW